MESHDLANERVRFRPLEIDDVDDVFALHNDLEIKTLTLGWPLPVARDVCREWIAQRAKAADEATWAAVQPDGHFAGVVRIMDIDRMSRHAELGLYLASAERGNGLGQATVKLACEWAFGFLGLHRMIARILSDNTRALTVFERAGFAARRAAPGSRVSARAIPRRRAAGGVGIGLTTAAILQPGYLPWLGFFEQMAVADVFVYLDDVQYTKSDWRNRNRVKHANGPVWLTVPVATVGRSGQDLRVTQTADDRWAARHAKTVANAYAHAPFSELGDGLREIWNAPPASLLQLDLLVIEWCRSVLGLRTPTTTASSLGITATDPSERLVRMCVELGADVFYEGAAGRNYLDQNLFHDAGIALEYQVYEHPWYPQQHRKAGFISHLSVLDLVLNCGPDALDILTGRLVLEAPSGTIHCHADDFRRVGGAPE